MSKILTKLESIVVFIFIFLVPFFVPYVSTNPYVVPKLELLIVGISVYLIVKVVKIITDGKLDFAIGKFDFPIILIAIAYLASTLLRTPNKMEAFLLPGTTTIILSSILVYFIINQLKTEDKKWLSHLLVVSGAVFSISIVFAYLGVFNKIPQLPAYLRSNNFSPEGGYLPSAIYLLGLIPFGIGLLLAEKEAIKKAVLSVSLIVIASGLVISLYNMMPGKPFYPQFPSLSTSWSVTIDSLKESPLLGIGSGNYLSAFNRYRPITYNATNLWALKFATANNFYLTMMAETGMLGVAGFLLLIYTFYKEIRQEIKERKLVHWSYVSVYNMVSLALILILLALFPITILPSILLFIFVAFNSKARHTSLNLTTIQDSLSNQAFSSQQVASRFPALLLTIPILLLVAFILTRSSRIFSAEFKFKKSLDALVANKATETYDTMRAAITLNSQVDRYHSTFSRVNLILANAIIQRATQTDKKQAEQLSDQDKTTITQLIQQAISEAKAAVALNVYRSSNWETLAQTYQSIIPFAQGSDNFAIQSYSQAIALDPFNPGLRIALGGIYYANKDYERASRVLELAVSIKPDLANSHYNLAYAYRDKGDIDSAIQQMSATLSLITDKNGKDYDLARKALEDLQSKKKAQTPATSGDQLTAPAQTQQQIKPQIQLPKDSEPPTSPLTPTPVPVKDLNITPVITPTPTPNP